MKYEDDWDEQEAMIGEELARRERVVDLDPHRTVTHLDNGVPRCYLGHPDCYDNHTAERLADEADWESDSE
jgi:hypothetical protein